MGRPPPSDPPPSSHAFPPGPNFLYMTPLLLLVLIPLAYGIVGVKKARLRSPIHFQQARIGTLGTSPWRAALSMALLSLPPFTILTLVVSSASALFYLFGSFVSLVLVITTTSNILHYIPSPSVYSYIALRFHSKLLRHLLSSLQFLVSLFCSILLLFFSVLSLSSLSTLPLQAIVPLIAFSSLFSVMFSGQSNIMTSIFVSSFVVVAGGCGLFIYFSVEDVTSLQALLPLRFSIVPSIFSTALGFLLTLYILTCSPTAYQLYFSLSTRHKLRICFVLYGVFLLVFCSFVFLLSSLFADFLSRHCQLNYTFSSLFQFIKYTLHPNSLLSYAVCTSLLLIPLSILQFLLLSTTSHFWEEFFRHRFSHLSSGKQLSTVQAMSFVLCVVLVLSVLGIHQLNLPFHLMLPLGFHVMSSLCSVIAVSFFVGHYLPFANSKGSLVALLLSLLLILLLLFLHLSYNDLPEVKATCIIPPRGFPPLKTEKNVSPEVVGPLLGRITSSIAHLPLYTHPLIIALFYLIVAASVSWGTGGEDLFVLDWNLVVYVCAPFSPPLGKRRSFVESESFRYAQQRNNVRYPMERQFLYG